MELLPLTLIAPKIQASEIFPALELIMSHQAITEAIAETNSQEKRNRLLPTHLIIALVIGLSWWSKDSIVDVLKNLVQGLSVSWIPKGIKWKTPSKSSISEARQRVGCAVMTRLFEKLARPMAKKETPSAFLKGLRWMARKRSFPVVEDDDLHIRAATVQSSIFLIQKKIVEFLVIQGAEKGRRQLFPKQD